MIYFLNAVSFRLVATTAIVLQTRFLTFETFSFFLSYQSCKRSPSSSLQPFQGCTRVAAWWSWLYMRMSWWHSTSRCNQLVEALSLICYCCYQPPEVVVVWALKTSAVLVNGHKATSNSTFILASDACRTVHVELQSIDWVIAARASRLQLACSASRASSHITLMTEESFLI